MGEGESYRDYKRRHAAACATLLEGMLKEESVDAAFIQEATTLVRYHDHTILPRNNVQFHRKIEKIRDADSLSFFSVNLDTYLAQHNDDPKRVRTKVNFMYEKMSDHGKELLEQSPNFSKIAPLLGLGS